MRCRGYRRTADSAGIGIFAGSLCKDAADDDFHTSGRQDKTQWSVSKGASGCSFGISCCGRELMLMMILGRTTATLSAERSNDTIKVMVGGYSKGAGSKWEGIRAGSHRVGVRLRYVHSMSRRGYAASKVVTRTARNSKSITN